MESGKDKEGSELLDDLVGSLPAVQETAMIVPLDTSLHTTSSDASMELDTFLLTATNDSGETKNNDELSFHASQVEESSLTQINHVGLECSANLSSDQDATTHNTDELVLTAQDDPLSDEIQPDLKHELDAMIVISQQLLKTEQPNKTNKNDETMTSSFMVQYRFLLLLTMAVGGLVQGINKWLQTATSLDISSNQVPPMQKILSLEDSVNLMIGDFKYRKEDIGSSSNGLPNLGMWQVFLFGMIAKLALPNKRNDNMNSLTNEQNSIDDEVPRIKTTELDKSDSESVPLLIPIKLQDCGNVSTSYDLSNYEKLTVMELRAFLRSRKCSYVGRKVHLIRRLVSIYNAELQSLTVMQLRQKLKSKQMKQGGLKSDLVQRLIEAGL